MCGYKAFAREQRRVASARIIMQEAFKADPDFRRTYTDSIACILLDTKMKKFETKSYRDQVADLILTRILE